MSNEQRAHDITLIYVNLTLKLTTPNEDNTQTFDPYKEYKKIYPQVLEKINRDFN